MAGLLVDWMELEWVVEMAGLFVDWMELDWVVEMAGLLVDWIRSILVYSSLLSCSFSAFMFCLVLRRYLY